MIFIEIKNWYKRKPVWLQGGIIGLMIVFLFFLLSCCLPILYHFVIPSPKEVGVRIICHLFYYIITFPFFVPLYIIYSIFMNMSLLEEFPFIKGIISAFLVFVLYFASGAFIKYYHHKFISGKNIVINTSEQEGMPGRMHDIGDIFASLDKKNQDQDKK